MNGRPPVGVCGLGLMGGSLARALLSGHDVFGFDPDPEAMERAGGLGVRTVDSLAGFAGCSVLALAAPTQTNRAVLHEVAVLGLGIPLMDLGSVKEPIERTWLTDPDVPFVGTHPMAGAELAGIAAADADLFRGAGWAVSVHPRTSPGALTAVIALVLSTGAVVVPVSAAGHDAAVAVASHLPHLLAAALAKCAGGAAAPDLVLQLGGGSFRDATRVLGSPPERTVEFLEANADHVADSTQRAAAVLGGATDRERLLRLFTEGRAVRARFEHRADRRSQDVVVRHDQLVSGLLGLRDTGAVITAMTADSDECRLTIRGTKADD